MKAMVAGLPSASGRGQMSDTSFYQRHRYSLSGFGLFVLLLVLLIIFWSWDWFVPLVNRQATAALGRPTTIEHLHVRLGRVTRVTVDKLRSEQPAPFANVKAPFFAAEHATAEIDMWKLLWHRDLFLPLIRLETPQADVERRKDGTNNYTFGSTKKDESKSSSSFSPSSIGGLEINDGHVHLHDDVLRADMDTALHTTPPKSDTDRGTIVADTTGRYAAQPIKGYFIGGALLSLTDAKTPYPVDLDVRNGATRVTLKGTVDDPLAFKGSKLKLHLLGPDMSLLYPLTGVPIPQTPPYDITGNLDYTANLIRFSDFRGRMGSSDLDGTLSVNPHDKPPTLEAALHSHRVDIADLGGFIGSKPGPQSQSEKKAEAKDPNVLPDTPINVPKLNAINAHVTYKGDHIENKRLPLDNIDTEFAVQDGAIDLKHLTFAVGKGSISAAATLTPAQKGFATKAKFDFSRLDLAHIMRTTTQTQAQGGIIGGNFTLTSTGNSIASLVANGNGGLTLVLSEGGDISALLPEALGLQLGNAILSALGLPGHTAVDCFLADMPLRNGVMNTKTLLLETRETRTLGSGSVDFRKNTIDYSLTTRSIGPTILSFPGAFNITGALKSPSVMPGAEIIGRAAAAAGLGFVFPPLALLPTIQLGVGKGSRCEAAVQAINAHPASGIVPPGARKGQPAPQGKKAQHSVQHGHTKAAQTKASSKERTMTPAEIRAAWEKKLHKN
ncbi:AsmA family protein [Acetobacter estunensis]|nr:AsmA family protein [Acetobacter estunensis]